MRPVENWQKVLRHAWSVRFLAAAAVLSGAEAALPLIDPLVPIKYRLAFAVASFLCVVAAFAARFIAQKKFKAD